MTFQSRLGFVRYHQTHVNQLPEATIMYQPCNWQQRDKQICRYFWGGPDLSFCEIEYHQEILCSSYCGWNILALSVFSLVASLILNPDTRAHVSQAIEMVSMAATDYLATREQKQKPPVNLHCINDPSLALARNPCS